MASPEQSLGEHLERFVREQASLFGEVISYVPATRSQSADSDSTASVLPVASRLADHSQANNTQNESEETLSMPGKKSTSVASSSAPEISVTHHGYAELEAMLAPYKDEPWTSSTSLDVMNEAIQGCMKCPLGQTRTNLVFGVGNPNAKVLVIGEAPGADEDATGEPFVGRAGQLLNKMLSAVKFEREEVYIANILKSRPPNNREPKPDEVQACEPYLWKQILLLKPKLIICMGRVAGTNLLKLKEPLGKMRGNVYDFHGIKVMVTYHPAALLRNPDWKHGAWEDLKQFRRLYEDLA